MKPKVIRADNVVAAAAELTKVNVHPSGVKIMALKAIYRLVKFEGIDPRTANIVKQEMLSRGGDVAVAQTVGLFENAKTDLIIMGTLAQYTRLIRKLKRQTYANCPRIGEELKALLFEDFDADSANVV